MNEKSTMHQRARADPGSECAQSRGESTMRARQIRRPAQRVSAGVALALSCLCYRSTSLQGRGCPGSYAAWHFHLQEPPPTGRLAWKASTSKSREPRRFHQCDRGRGFARLPRLPGATEHGIAADRELRQGARPRREHAGEAKRRRRIFRALSRAAPRTLPVLTAGERVQFTWTFYEMFGAFEFMFHQVTL